MKFRSRKSGFFSLLLPGSSVFLVLVFVLGIWGGYIGEGDYWIAIPFAVIIAFFFWIYFGTSYELTEYELAYRSGPIRGKIQLGEIREIVKGKTLYSGLKPATAAKGLIIKFRKYDEVYISPDSNDFFVEEILKRKPGIVISE